MNNERNQAPPKWKAYSMRELSDAFFADLIKPEPRTQKPRSTQEDPQKDGGRPAA